MTPAVFFRQKTEKVARELVGMVLCRRLPDGSILRARITETEAYLGIEDRAAHTFGGRRTERVRSMWLSGGHSYVYFIYGMHFCLNVVTRSEKHPEAVLIRGVKLLGDDANHFGKTDGPAKLCKVMQITKADDGIPLWNDDGDLWIEKRLERRKPELHASPRVGIDYAGEAVAWPLRFRELSSAPKR